MEISICKQMKKWFLSTKFLSNLNWNCLVGSTFCSIFVPSTTKTFLVIQEEVCKYMKRKLVESCSFDNNYKFIF